MLKTSWTAALPSYEPKHAGKKAKFWWENFAFLQKD
jgi:hypothetical protein